MKSTFMVVLLTLTSLSAWAQTGELIVADLTTLQAIPDAQVFISINNIELPKLLGKTETNGQFNLPDLAYKGSTLIIQAEGYELYYLQSTELHADFIAYLVPSVTSMNTLIISAKRNEEFLRSSTSEGMIISRNSIQHINPGNSADLLSQTSAALVQKSQLGGGSPILRGFEANKVMFVVDGVRMNNAIYRGGHLQDILSLDPMAMERVEVVYGPGSATYGSDALGGVMSFYTRNPKFTNGNITVHAGAMFKYSTADQSGVHGNVEVQGERVSSFTAFTFNNFGDLRQGNIRSPQNSSFGQRPWYVERINDQDSVMVNKNPNVQVGSGYKQVDFLQKIAFSQNKYTTHILNFQYSTTNDVPRYDRLTQVSGNAPKYAEWYYGPQTRLMAAYHLNVNKENRLFSSSRITAAFQNIDQSRHDRKLNNLVRNNRIEQVQVYSINADFNKSFKAYNQNLGYGIETYFNQVNSSAFGENILDGTESALDTRYPDGGSQIYAAAAYLTHQITLSPKVKLSEGIRYTKNSLRASFIDKTFFDFPFSDVQQNNQATTGSIGINFQPNKKWILRTQFSTGFRTPNVDDLAKVFESNQGNLIVPNNELKPEKVQNIEGGITKIFNQKTELTASAYYSKYIDALTTAQTSYNGQDSVIYNGSMSAVVTSVNAAEAYIWGGQLNLNSQLNEHVGIQSNVVYTYGRIKNENGDTPLDHIPPVYGRTGISYQQKKIKGEFYVFYNGWKRLEDYRLNAEDNESYATSEGMPSWYTLNARLSYQLTENIQAMAALENILDMNYRVFASNISGAGRNLTVTLRGNF
jgi:hemoglobin/transferrin/lactoferrin receptor protein